MSETLTTDKTYPTTATLKAGSTKKNEIYADALVRLMNKEETLGKRHDIKDTTHLKNLIHVFLQSSIKQKNYEKMKNFDFYNKNKKLIEEDYMNKFIVISDGKIKKVGNSLSEVKDTSLEAKHRLIFKVEPETSKRVTLRWPMKSQ